MKALHRIFQDLDEVKAKEALLLIGEAVSRRGSLDHTEFEEILNVVEIPLDAEIKVKMPVRFDVKG